MWASLYRWFAIVFSSPPLWASGMNSLCAYQTAWSTWNLGGLKCRNVMMFAAINTAGWHDVSRASQWPCLRMSRSILYFKATRSWTSWLRCSVAFNAKIPKTQDCFDCFDCLATQRLSAIMLDRSLEIGILLTSRPRGPCRPCGGPCGAFYVEGRRDLWDIAAWYWRPCLSRKMPCELCWQPWP